MPPKSSWEYLVAGGNGDRTIASRSEPAWKVRTTFTRKSAYPFADGDVRWVGTIESLADGQKPLTDWLNPLAAATFSGERSLHPSLDA